MLSWKEGSRLAEAEAWRTRGKNNAWWYIYGKRLAPPAVGALLLGIVGYALYRLWRMAAGAFSGATEPTGLGGGTLAFTVVLLVASTLALRGLPSRIRSAGEIALTALAVLVAWVTFGLYVLASSF